MDSACPDKHSFDFILLDCHIEGTFVCIAFEKKILFINSCSHILFRIMIFSERIRCLLHCEGSACVPAVKPLLLALKLNLKKKVRKGSKRILYRKQGITEPIEFY